MPPPPSTNRFTWRTRSSTTMSCCNMAAWSSLRSTTSSAMADRTATSTPAALDTPLLTPCSRWTSTLRSWRFPVGQTPLLTNPLRTCVNPTPSCFRCGATRACTLLSPSSLNRPALSRKMTEWSCQSSSRPERQVQPYRISHSWVTPDAILMRCRASITLAILDPICRRRVPSSWFWMPRLSQNWAEQRSPLISPAEHTASSPTLYKCQHLLPGVRPRGGFQDICGCLKGKKKPESKIKSKNKIKSHNWRFFFSFLDKTSALGVCSQRDFNLQERPSPAWNLHNHQICPPLNDLCEICKGTFNRDHNKRKCMWANLKVKHLNPKSISSPFLGGGL